MGILDLIKARANTQKTPEQIIAEIRARNEAAEAETAIAQEIRLKNYKTQELIGRSGIMPIHQGCTVNNFIAETEDQWTAKNFARDYVLNFGDRAGGFIFSGNTGTGKNHLSAAICNALMAQGKTCLVITVNELMIKLRACYGNESTMREDVFIKSMVDIDLLILDEIGLQRSNTNEQLVLNQIIDQRVGNLKPTGMLTNLPSECEHEPGSKDWYPNMNSLLGPRIMDRMKSNGGKWISFNWESYRK